MSRYTCKNFDLKLKIRVLIGFTILVANFIAFVIGCMSVIDCLKNPYSSTPVTSIGGISALCCAVIIFPIWYKYCRDLKSKSEFAHVNGKVVSYNRGVVMLETKDGFDTFMISKEVEKSLKMYEGSRMDVIRSKNGGLIKEITVES